MKKASLKVILFVVLIGILFVSISHIVQTNLNFFENAILKNNSLSIFVYIILTALFIVFVPLTTIPIIPLASNVWGWVVAGILSIIGWVIGSLTAFFIARKYGKPIVRKFIPISRIEKIEKLAPEENVFLSLILLRIALPIDLLSYALGLFTKIKTRTFFLTTLIGIAPFAFIFAYMGNLPVYLQIFGLFLALLVILILFLSVKKRKKIR